MDKLISIIVPVHKVEKYLRRCVDSILAQTYQNIEVLLIDDGSPDSSGTICDEYAQKDARVRVFHKENGGVSSARNLGLKEAKGEYIGFVDADDYILHEMYENMIAIIKENHADIAICGYKKEQTDGTFEPYFKKDVDCTFTKKEMIANLLTNKYYTCAVWSMLFRRNSIDGVEFDINRKHNEDLLFIYEVMKRMQIAAFTSDTYYLYCTNEGSATTSGFSSSMMDIVYISEYILQDIQMSMPELYGLERREFMRNNITTAMSAVKARYTDTNALMHIRKNIRKHLLPYMFGSASIGYKFYALVIALNWKLLPKNH